MEQIGQFQKWLGQPVLAFLQDYWIFVAVIGFVTVAYFFIPGWGNDSTVTLPLGDDDSDSGGSDGGGDSGGD